MPDAFVTGGSGFIGGALIDRLVADGRSVRALARSPEAVAAVERRGARAVEGSMTDVSSWADELAGTGTLFHVAGVNEMCLRDPSILEQVNVTGTSALVRAAAGAGVDRMVLTSSAAAIGEQPGETGTEHTPHSGEFLSKYAESKYRSEQVAVDLAGQLDVSLISVNPSSVQGPGRIHGTGRIFMAFLRGKLRVVVPARVSTVFIGDVVAGHLLAESVGRPGERYLLSGWSATVDEMLDVLAAVTGEHRRVRRLPLWALTAGAAVVEAGYRLVRRRPPLCRELARTIRHGHVFDGSRATRDLGLRYTPPQVWLAKTVDWYRAQGLI